MISYDDIAMLAPGTPLSSLKENQMKALKSSFKEANVTTEVSAFKDLSDVTHLITAFEDSPDKHIRSAMETIRTGIEKAFNDPTDV